MPILYTLGWLVSRPFYLLGFPWLINRLDLLGTLFSFLFFLGLLPSWARLRWCKSRPWSYFGLCVLDGEKAWKSFLKGISWALFLLCLIIFPLLVGGGARWIGNSSFSGLLNAFLLGTGVGFAEELIFRGWLLGELNELLPPSWGLVVQALVFSLIHLRMDQGLWPMLSLLMGLFLLGLFLAIRRKLDGGLIWGCIGIHGGLVGGWLFINLGLLQFSPNAPVWLIGPGGLNPNPLGGMVAIGFLILMIWRQLNALAMAR